MSRFYLKHVCISDTEYKEGHFTTIENRTGWAAGGSLPSREQPISPYCGICIGSLACLVVYSVDTSCKIQTTARGFSLIQNIEDCSGAHTACYSVTDGGFFFSRRGGVKHPGFGADLSLVSSAVIKNVLGHTLSCDDSLHVCTGRT